MLWFESFESYLLECRELAFEHRMAVSNDSQAKPHSEPLSSKQLLPKMMARNVATDLSMSLEQDPNARNCHGYRKFVKRMVLEGQNSGYLLNDTLIIRYCIELVVSSGGALSKQPSGPVKQTIIQVQLTHSPINLCNYSVLRGMKEGSKVIFSRVFVTECVTFEGGRRRSLLQPYLFLAVMKQLLQNVDERSLLIIFYPSCVTRTESMPSPKMLLTAPLQPREARSTPC